MSLRSSTRLAQPLRASLRSVRPTQALARRANSSSSGGAHKSSDTMWQLGAVGGWGSLSAWVYMHYNGSGKDDHHHGHPPHKEAEMYQGLDEAKAIKEQGEEADSDGEEGEDSGVSAENVKKSVTNAAKSVASKAGISSGEEGDEAPEGNEEAKDADGDEGAEVSDKDVADSLAQAEKAAVPRLAKATEEK